MREPCPLPSDYRQRDKGEKTRQKTQRGEKVRYKRRRMKFLVRKFGRYE